MYPAGSFRNASLDDQMRALRMFSKHVGGGTLLDETTARDAESFIAARLQSGVKVATANKDIRTLKRIFNLAIEPRGYLSAGANPFAKVRQRKISRKPVRYVKPEEFGSLLAVNDDPWWRALLATAYTTAARLGEMLHLTWSDVDFERDRIRVVVKDADGELHSWEPKDHEGRVLPVPPEVVQLLADLQVTAADGCPYVFVPPWRWKHIQAAKQVGTWREDAPLLNNLHRRFRTRVKKAGVAKCTLHDLRRTCITNWARHLPIHVVRQLAGHSDLKTTQHYYLAVEEDDLARARVVQQDLLPALLHSDPKVTHTGHLRVPPGSKRKTPVT